MLLFRLLNRLGSTLIAKTAFNTLLGSPQLSLNMPGRTGNQFRCFQVCQPSHHRREVVPNRWPWGGESQKHYQQSSQIANKQPAQMSSKLFLFCEHYVAFKSFNFFNGSMIQTSLKLSLFILYQKVSYVTCELLWAFKYSYSSTDNHVLKSNQNSTAFIVVVIAGQNSPCIPGWP